MDIWSREKVVKDIKRVISKEKQRILVRFDNCFCSQAKRHITNPIHCRDKLRNMDASWGKIEIYSKELVLKKVKSVEHRVFPSGLPSKYWLGSRLLNFGDRTRPGAFNLIWSYTLRHRKETDLLIADQLLSSALMPMKVHFQSDWPLIFRDFDQLLQLPFIWWHSNCLSRDTDNHYDICCRAQESLDLHPHRNRRESSVTLCRRHC